MASLRAFTFSRKYIVVKIFTLKMETVLYTETLYIPNFAQLIPENR
jgi:hypothetical protein